MLHTESRCTKGVLHTCIEVHERRFAHLHRVLVKERMDVDARLCTNANQGVMCWLENHQSRHDFALWMCTCQSWRDWAESSWLRLRQEE